jgi:hypothetical protein
MKTKRAALETVAVALAAVLLVGEARAHRRTPARFGAPETYTALKAGGYELDSRKAGADAPGGVFVGFELGASPSPFVELGFSADWFHRREGREEIFLVETPYELPVEGVIELDGTSTDLVPLGGVARLRLPLSDGRFVPFLSGHLTYDILRLEYREADAGAGANGSAERSDYFLGFGKSVSIGLESKLDRSFGLIAEVGVHESRPEKDMTVNDVPVRAEVDAGGGFARFGMRFAFH